MARAFDQAGVDVQALHGGNHAGTVVDAQVDFGLRRLPQQIGDARRQQVVADGGTGRKHQPQRCTLRRVAASGQLPLQVGSIDQQRARRFQQRAAVAVQGQAATDAVEKRRAEVRFQLLQGGAAGRLRKCDGLTGGSGAAVVGDSDEDLQLAQGQAHGAYLLDG
uniref:Uncharacterized protein n=1 Tax=Panagrolaimus superbus TaxID=310955 RepID=A0A914YNP0_9BILA